ncbi:hypothetical protein BJ165DRAFT_1494175, partial [Panaeolus papilionaceus]
MLGEHVVRKVDEGPIRWKFAKRKIALTHQHFREEKTTVPKTFPKIPSIHASQNTSPEKKDKKTGDKERRPKLDAKISSFKHQISTSLKDEQNAATKDTTKAQASNNDHNKTLTMFI